MRNAKTGAGAGTRRAGRLVQGEKAAGTDTGSMRADAKDGRADGVPLINSLEFFINSFNF